MDLIERIRSGQACAGVVGLGYVGLPLAVEMAVGGLKVIGFDVQVDKVDAINAGHSYIMDVPDETLAPLVSEGRLQATTDFSMVAELDTVNICVPTPLRKTKEPNLSFVIDAVKSIAAHMKPGQLMILESTTYPGTTEELVLPMLREAGFEPGRDVFVAFSPERTDPGNKDYTTRNIPKVVGGHDPVATEAAAALYGRCIDQVVLVSTTRVAEMVKLLENTFRSVNIALVNEIGLMCDRFGIDVWEVIDAAATKPFGFMPFYPGPGLGGHCIPVDPHYLTWKARAEGFSARFIELAAEINAEKPAFVVSRAADLLNEQEKSVRGAAILCLGVAYKANTNDVRESPALDVMTLLLRKGANISFCDPYVDKVVLEGEPMSSVPLEDSVLRAADLVILLTNHSVFDLGLVSDSGCIVLDTRNGMKEFPTPTVVKI
ncbi:MAG: nucleotide sugar dehydrogenase [Deltaproteobacteria bacterium]|nr:nucleotide sugar dehydrogenase [Deltaproteobacteria bacterium]